MKDILITVGIVYLSMESLLMTLTFQPFILTQLLFEKTTRIILGKRSCLLGYHWWVNVSKKYRCSGLPHGIDNIEAMTRHCEGCDKDEYTFDLFSGWKHGKLTEPIQFKEV